ncbi:hypothetical protein ABZ930_41190 [Streptomyces sp. NPDC046716]|uniref:hypothetical protein n=1 Tax=Streptomyces sp. NPDC046716 TaxID=3157093 RepID=UPI0033C5E5E1
MTPTTDSSGRSPAVQQLRRIRLYYAAGVLTWTASLAWTAWWHPGSRQMWVVLLLLGVFSGLFTLTSLWLRTATVRADRVVSGAL